MPIKILVVDDEISSLSRLISQSFYSQIRDRQYEFTYASNGKEAWEKILGERPDLVLTDIRMPKLDGLTLLNRLKHLNIKAIVISAYGTVENLRRAMQERANDFLVKPLNRKELTDTVERVLQAGGDGDSLTAPVPHQEAGNLPDSKIRFVTVLRFAKNLSPTKQYKLVSQLLERFSLTQIEDLKEDLPALQVLALEEEERREEQESEDRQRLDQGKIPLSLLEKGYVEERFQKYQSAAGEEKQYRYLYLRWQDPKTDRLRGRLLKKQDLKDPLVRSFVERKLGKPVEP